MGVRQVVQWVGVAGAMFALDVVFAMYVIATSSKAAEAAAGWASAIVLLNGAVTLSFVRDRWMLVPAAIGAFAGTWSAIRFV